MPGRHPLGIAAGRDLGLSIAVDLLQLTHERFAPCVVAGCTNLSPPMLPLDTDEAGEQSLPPLV